MNQLNVIGPDSIDNTTVDRTIDGRDRKYRRPVLGLEKAVPHRASASGRGARRLHLSIERAIHPRSQHASESNKIRVGD